jgi:hypothetical protein
VQPKLVQPGLNRRSWIKSFLIWIKFVLTFFLDSNLKKVQHTAIGYPDIMTHYCFKANLDVHSIFALIGIKMTTGGV